MTGNTEVCVSNELLLSRTNILKKIWAEKGRKRIWGWTSSYEQLSKNGINKNPNECYRSIDLDEPNATLSSGFVCFIIKHQIKHATKIRTGNRAVHPRSNRAIDYAVFATFIASSCACFWTREKWLFS